jgi:hypothetical protein
VRLKLKKIKDGAQWQDACLASLVSSPAEGGRGEREGRERKKEKEIKRKQTTKLNLYSFCIL